MRPTVPIGLLAAVAAGGAVGTLLRAWVEDEFPARPGGFPWGTLAVNLIGSLILGFVVAASLIRSMPSRYLRPLLGTGLCGGFTTFSTFVVEADLLIRGGHPGTAVGYVGVSVLGGLAAAWAGALPARLIWRRT